MDESKLETSELKSHEVKKGDDNSYTLNVACSLGKNDEICEEKCHRDNSLKLAEETCKIPSDNCSRKNTANGDESEKKEYVNGKTELTTSSPENVNFDGNKSKRTSQEFKNVQVITDYQNSAECTFSSTYTDIPVRDSLPKILRDETEKRVQVSGHVDESATTVSDHTCICNSSESKNHISEISTENVQSDKDTSSMFHLSSYHRTINATKLENEVINDVVSTENVLSSINNSLLNVNENTDFRNVLVEVEKTIAEEKVGKNITTCFFPDTDNLPTVSVKRKSENTEEISKHNKEDCDNVPFSINSNTSKNDINAILRNGNHKTIYKADLTENLLENEFPKGFKFSDISNCNMTENKLTEVKYTGLLLSKDTMHLHPSDRKTEENSREPEGIIPSKIELRENASNIKDKKNLCVNIKDKKNCETIKTFSDDEDCGENLYCTDSGNTDLNNILTQESVINKSGNIIKKFDESECCISEFCYCSADSKIKKENKSHIKVIKKDEGSNDSADSAISQIHVREVTVAQETETEHSVPYNDGDWEILQSSTDYHTEEAKNMQQNIKSETVEKTSEKCFEDLLCPNLDDYEVVNDLSDRKAFKEKEFFPSLHTTVNNCVSSLMRCDILNINKYTKYIFGTKNKMGSETNVDEEDMPSKSIIHSSNISENWNDNGNVTKQIERGEVTVSQCCKIESCDIKTLEDALNYFNLCTLIDELEVSLEDVRRRRKTEKAHEIFLKDVDKRIQKLSFKYHPDRIRNKGGSEKEIQAAEKLQASVNAVRTALNILNEAFLEDLDTDHKYGFYTKLELSSLANENEVKSHIYEVLFKIDLLSEIKQQKIISQIQKFLIISQNCVQSYFDGNVCDFEKHRDLSLFYLKSCIKGYKKLQKELEVIENECKVEKLHNICCNIRRMNIENQRTLTLLRDLKRLARKSLAGSFQIFTPSEVVDEYFVLPFVYYMNVILMCSVMVNGTKVRGVDASESHLIDFKIFKINGISFSHPYLLILSFIDNEQCKWLFKENISKEELKQEFDKYLACFNDYLKDKFKECDYTYGSGKSYLSEELKKCMKMMKDFQMKEKELSKDIENFKSKIEEKDEKYEKIMKQNEELNKIVEEQMEKNKNLSQRISLALSKHD